MTEQLAMFEKELSHELESILTYWMDNAIDETNGGFDGRIDNDNIIYKDAAKGSVLNSRILWSFSAAYNLTNNQAYLQIAERAYKYLLCQFLDPLNGGVYWTVDFKGNALDTKKQFYALSFAVYGLSEFAKCHSNDDAKQQAISLYNTIIDKSYDQQYGGYIEALSKDWKEQDDIRLSDKDANEKKSMNTHLHILEAFANLYTIWPAEELKKRIEELISIFLNHITDKNTHHLILFFDGKWTARSDVISYGHDIEAAWLIQEAAEIIGNADLVKMCKMLALQLTNAVLEGLDIDGGLWYEYEKNKKHLVREKHWWPQAEAMVGFYNAWQITNDNSWLQRSFQSWQFIKDYILDKKNGEWFWGVKERYEVMDEDKVGIWKCPYHNSRACIEIIKRINRKKLSDP
ncbi:MAG: AGE family epimerase/isomerase [Ginsengibacter sp.]